MPSATVTAIVPRWEWRAFGDDLGPAERRLQAGGAARVEESDDLYLLSPGSDASVKVRGGQMDVKRCDRIDPDGLERWRPVLKAAFPLTADEVAEVLAALGVDAPVPGGGAATLDDLVRAASAGGATVVALPVRKRRAHVTFGGCRAEVTDLRTDAGTLRTIAVEAEDPERVRAAVGALGLGGRRNVCVARGLKTLVGLEPERYAVIDVGTNSVKLHVAERAGADVWRTLADRAVVTRLGEDLDRTGRLGAAPVRRTADAITAMAADAVQHGCREIAAVGTAGMRVAANAADLVDAVRASCGVTIEVIPAEEEARLAYVGAVAGLGAAGGGSLAVFDTGGGSSQFTFGHGRDVDERFSVGLGAVRVTERFGLNGPVPRSTLEAAFAAIAEDLERLRDRPGPDLLVGMGGAVTNLAAIRSGLRRYDPEAVQGSELTLGEIDRQIDLFAQRTAEERKAVVGLQPARAEVILAGACIVRTIAGLLGRDALVVSDRGLRHGVLAERFGARAASAGVPA